MRLPLLLGLPTLLVAQSATTSALTGLVRDPGGKPLKGATIRITSPSLIGGERATRTAENGSYRFPVLPPGLYKIVAEAGGYPSMSGSEVLELGRTANVNWTFHPITTATVEVVGSATTLEATPTVVTKNYNAESIAVLPTANRSLTDLLNLTPGVNGGSAWGGTDSGANAYLMDGINVGDPSGGSQWIYTNMDWFDEVQVGGLGAAAEFGGFSGGFVNTIVKRGGNEGSGVLSGYYDSTQWQARSSNKDWPWTPAELAIPDSKNYDLSANVGGAILKDKLWYFFSAQREQNEQTFIGSLDTGPLAPRKIASSRFLGKVTWQALPTATLEGMVEYDSRDIQHKYVNTSWGDYEPLAGGGQSSPSRYFTATWTQTLGSSTVLTLKANGFTGGYDVRPYNGDAHPLVIDGDKYYNNVDVAEINRRSRASLAATLDWFRTGLLSATDSHAFRFGLEREQTGSESQAWNPGGFVLHADSNGDGTYTPYKAQTEFNENVRVRSNRLVLFAQDSWTLSDRLTLRPGLRYERDTMSPYGGGNLWDTRTLAPRLGATLGLTPDQKHVLKVHWGRFFDGIEAGYIDRSIPGAHPAQLRWWWDDNAFSDLHNPPVTNLTPRTSVGTFTNLDPKAHLPYADETMASYEAKLDENWVSSLTWVHRKWSDMLIRYDRNLQSAGGYAIYDPITGRAIPVVDTPTGNEDWYVTNDDRAKRAYWAWTLAAERRLADSWSFAGSYTHARTYGNVTDLRGGASTFENPNYQINADGRLGGYHDHEVKLRGLYEFPSKTRISGSFTYLSGERWTRTLMVDDLGMDWYGSVFAEPRGTEKFPARKLLDLRLSQGFALGRAVSAEVFLDIFNVFNDCATTDLNTRSNATTDVNTVDTTTYADYLKPTLTQDSRKLRIGFRVKF